MMEVQKCTISLSELWLCDDTQQRAIDPETVGLYAERIKAGDKFPPVEVVKAPQGLVPWDGWHRIKAAQQSGVVRIEANIRPGTLLDAVRLSYRANGRNGRPLTPHEKASIVAKVYADRDLYNRVTHKEIGGWVGLTASAVSKIISKLRISENGNFHYTGCRGGTSRVEDAKGAGTLQSNPDGQVAAKKAWPKADEPVRTTAPPKAAVEPDRPTDQEGVPLPEHLIPIFERRREILAWRGHVDALWDRVKGAIDSGDPFFRYVRLETIKTECMNLRRAIKFAMPYAVCAYCSGDGGVERDCRACDGTGWVNEETWYVTPKEYKAAMKKLAEVSGSDT